jgi:hypothetical protein
MRPTQSKLETSKPMARVAAVRKPKVEQNEVNDAEQADESTSPTAQKALIFEKSRTNRVQRPYKNFIDVHRMMTAHR